MTEGATYSGFSETCKRRQTDLYLVKVVLQLNMVLFRLGEGLARGKRGGRLVVDQPITGC